MFEAYNKSVPLNSVCVCVAETARLRERASESLK